MDDDKWKNFEVTRAIIAFDLPLPVCRAGPSARPRKEERRRPPKRQREKEPMWSPKAPP